MRSCLADAGHLMSPARLICLVVRSGRVRAVPPVCMLARVAGSTVGGGEGVHHAGPLARKLTGQLTGTRAVAAGSPGPCRAVHGAAAGGLTWGGGRWRGWPGPRSVGAGSVPPGAGCRGGQVVRGRWGGGREA